MNLPGPSTEPVVSKDCPSCKAVNSVVKERIGCEKKHVCKECGEVIDYISVEYDNSADCQTYFSTKLGQCPNTAARKMWHNNKPAHSKVKISGGESQNTRAVNKGLKMVHQLCIHFHLSDKTGGWLVQKDAMNILKDAAEQFCNVKREWLSAVCVYVAARQHGIQLVMKEVAAAADMPFKRFSSLFLRASKHLKTDFTRQPKELQQIIRQCGSEINFDEGMIDLAVAISEFAESNAFFERFIGRKRGSATVMLYCAQLTTDANSSSGRFLSRPTAANADQFVLFRRHHKLPEYNCSYALLMHLLTAFSVAAKELPWVMDDVEPKKCFRYIPAVLEHHKSLSFTHHLVPKHCALRMKTSTTVPTIVTDMSEKDKNRDLNSEILCDDDLSDGEMKQYIRTKQELENVTQLYTRANILFDVDDDETEEEQEELPNE